MSTYKHPRIFGVFLMKVSEEATWSSAEGSESNRPVVTDGAWEDPDYTLLDDRRGELPQFPWDVLTPAWRRWLLRAHGAGVRPEHVIVPLLGVASGLVGTA